MIGGDSYKTFDQSVFVDGGSNRGSWSPQLIKPRIHERPGMGQWQARLRYDKAEYLTDDGVNQCTVAIVQDMQPIGVVKPERVRVVNELVSDILDLRQ